MNIQAPPRPLKPSRSRVAWVLALTVAGIFGVAHADELQVARSVMLVPADTQLESVALPSGEIKGDGNILTQRRLAKLTHATGAATYLIVESVSSGGGRFQWSESCKSVKSSPQVFVHSPFHTLRDQCVLVQGPHDLKGSLATIDPEAAEQAEQLNWELGDAGYVITAKFALSSGALLSVNAFIALPFAGQTVSGPLPRNTSAVPEGVIAWAMTLNQEVQSSVLSLSGKWQLPPIKQQ